MKRLFFMTFIFYCSDSFSFMNVETMRQSHKNGFFGSVNLKLTGASGSTDKFVSDLSSQNVYRSDEDEFLFFINHLYGEVSNTKNTDRGSFHVRYSRSLSKVTALEFYSQVEFDKFRALRLRRIYGTGLRLQLLDRKTTSVYFGAGAFYENEDLEIDLDEQTARGNIYLAHTQNFENEVQLSTSFYYQPSLSQNDFRVRLDAGLGIPLTSKFKFTIEFQAAHDSAPPSGIVKNDSLYLTGLAYSY